MVSRLRNLLSQRYGFILLVVLVLVSVSFITRIALLFRSLGEIDVSVPNLLIIFGFGLFYDLVNAFYFIIPFVFILWLVPNRIYRQGWHRYVLYVSFFLVTCLLLFNAAAEWFFWDEFSTRFNFIAVDYLVYTTEVIGNIRESYPITWIILGIATLAGIIVFVLRKWIAKGTDKLISFKQRSYWTAGLLLPVLFFYFTVTNKGHRVSENTYVNELDANGMYELFAAYLNNELSYEQFYTHIDNKDAFQASRQLLTTSNCQFTSNDPLNIERLITNPEQEKKLNVVLISIESFSAEFMNAFGSTKNLTPNLDSLADSSLFFTNLYATGTRTVRGLEALSLAVPPTPGQSIVRRPDNENLFSLGKVFGEKGYESKYIYGGYGYFDNMNYFFANNGYTVVDRTSLADEEIDYENIWGVADENLFTLSIREIDKTVASGKPSFAHIMTTSNHRPFTYPEGRIDIPSHSGRDGAVKYTDYAIGKFLAEARTHSWFDSTIFVIVADHCASSAGATELPVDKYHIPMLIYSPANIQPQRMDRLMSQIDIAPTVLGLLNFEYASKFYGYDIMRLPQGKERAFISTYQKLGYIKDNKLVILAPQQEVEVYALIGESYGQKLDPKTEPLVKEAVAWYQSASYAFHNGLMK